MKLKVIEVTDGFNWGKFGVARPDEEWHLKSEVDRESPMPLFRQLGWGPDHLWVLDLQTGEGAFFRPGGYAKADLDKHRIWVCPMFEVFLTWLYEQDLKDLDVLPAIVETQTGEHNSLHGYRRSGETWMADDPLPDLPLGDTTELDRSWDWLMEHHPDAATWFAVRGVSPHVVSKMMRLGSMELQ